MSRVLDSDIKKFKNKRKSFWGVVVAITTIIYGIYFVKFEGYFASFLEPSMQFLPEIKIGVTMIVIGIAKLVGIVIKNNPLRAISLWIMSLMWGGLLFTSLAFSFGTGYPNTVWVHHLLMVVICLRTSLKGVDYPVWK